MQFDKANLEINLLKSLHLITLEQEGEIAMQTRNTSISGTDKFMFVDPDDHAN